MIRINDIHSVPLVARSTGVDYIAGSDVCIAHYNHTDKLTSGVLFTNSNNYSSEIHIASFVPHWGGKEMLYFVFFYAFRFRKWEKLFGRVPDDKPEALNLDLKLGFEIEAHLNDVFKLGVGLSIVNMYKSKCKYLSMKPPKITFPNSNYTSIVPNDPTYSLELSQELL